MDRYFDRSYNPALDVRSELDVDQHGFVNDDGWDRVLDVVRDKKRQKREKRGDERHERRSVGGGTSKDRSELLKTQYAKAGEKRAWDKGKQ
jgi:hypothetical protein